MFCSKCGKKNEDSASFCNGCGAPLVANNPLPVEEQAHTTGTKIRSGAILALIGAILSLLVVLFLEKVFFDPTKTDFTNNFYVVNNLLVYACIALIPVYGIAIWKSAHTVSKIMSVVGILISVFACFISFLCFLFGLANLEVLCIFNILNTVAMVILLVGSIKAVVGAFSIGKKR